MWVRVWIHELFLFKSLSTNGHNYSSDSFVVTTILFEHFQTYKQTQTTYLYKYNKPPCRCSRVLYHIFWTLANWTSSAWRENQSFPASPSHSGHFLKLWGSRCPMWTIKYVQIYMLALVITKYLELYCKCISWKCIQRCFTNNISTQHCN